MSVHKYLYHNYIKNNNFNTLSLLILLLPTNIVAIILTLQINTLVQY